MEQVGSMSLLIGVAVVLFIFVLALKSFKLPKDYEEKQSARNQLLKKKAEKEDITQMLLRELKSANDDDE